jgi:peptidoglycan/xylan/chitin deacetylase (PgdA/CDA1 family)
MRRILSLSPSLLPLVVATFALSACSSWTGKEELAVRRPASLQTFNTSDAESDAALAQMLAQPQIRESLQLKVDQIEELFYRGQDTLAQYDQLLSESVQAKLAAPAFLDQVTRTKVYPRLLATQALNDELTDRLTYFVLHLSDIAADPLASESRDKALDGLKYLSSTLSQAPLSTRIALNAWAEEMFELAPRSSVMQPVYAHLFVHASEAMQVYRGQDNVRENMHALIGEFRARGGELNRRLTDLTETYLAYAKAPTTRLPVGQWSFALVGGPSPKVTPELLHAFHAQRQQAAFFFVGDKMEIFPDMVRLISVGGMSVGNESQTGREMSRLFGDELKQELSSANKLIKDGTGGPAAYFIAPTSDVVADPIQSLALRENGLKLIRSHIDGFNWLDRDPNSVTARLQNQMRIWPSGVVVIHDGFEESVQTVHDVLVGLARQSPGSVVRALPAFQSTIVSNSKND